MKNSKSTLFLLLISLTLIVSVRPALAANQYSVNPGANFRWDATKYYYYKDGLGQDNPLSYAYYFFLLVSLFTY